MPKEIQNKIDEEFDKLLWSIKPEEAENENEVIKDFIHSKLQEAENRIKKEINKEWLSVDLSYSNKENWDKELTKFGLYMQKINSLQTNKE